MYVEAHAPPQISILQTEVALPVSLRPFNEKMSLIHKTMYDHGWFLFELE